MAVLARASAPCCVTVGVAAAVGGVVGVMDGVAGEVEVLVDVVAAAAAAVVVVVVVAAAAAVIALVAVVEVCLLARNPDAHVLERREAWMPASALPCIPAGAGDLVAGGLDTERMPDAAAAAAGVVGYAEAYLALVVDCTFRVAAYMSSHS